MAVHEPDLPYLPPSTAEYQGAPVLLGKSCEIQARVVNGEEEWGRDGLGVWDYQMQTLIHRMEDRKSVV